MLEVGQPAPSKKPAPGSKTPDSNFPLPPSSLPKSAQLATARPNPPNPRGMAFNCYKQSLFKKYFDFGSIVRVVNVK